MMASRPSCPLTCPGQSDLTSLLAAGVDVMTLAKPVATRMARGFLALDGLFEPDAAGQRWWAFPRQDNDEIVFWQPADGRLASWTGHAFALGEDIVDNPGTYAFDCNLNIFNNPLEWLRAKRDGIVVLDWTRAFDRLRDVPRIAIAEALLPTYRRHMRPGRMPELLVIGEQRRTAA